MESEVAVKWSTRQDRREACDGANRSRFIGMHGSGVSETQSSRPEKFMTLLRRQSVLTRQRDNVF
jgi:hypothetical protein